MEEEDKEQSRLRKMKEDEEKNKEQSKYFNRAQLMMGLLGINLGINTGFFAKYVWESAYYSENKGTLEKLITLDWVCTQTAIGVGVLALSLGGMYVSSKIWGYKNEYKIWSYSYKNELEKKE